MHTLSFTLRMQTGKIQDAQALQVHPSTRLRTRLPSTYTALAATQCSAAIKRECIADIGHAMHAPGRKADSAMQTIIHMRQTCAMHKARQHVKPSGSVSSSAEVHSQAVHPLQLRTAPTKGQSPHVAMHKAGSCKALKHCILLY